MRSNGGYTVVSTTDKLTVAPKLNEVGATSVFTSSKLLPLAKVISDAPESVLTIFKAAVADIASAVPPLSSLLGSKAKEPAILMLACPDRDLPTANAPVCVNARLVEPLSDLPTVVAALPLTRMLVEPDNDLMIVRAPLGVTVILAAPLSGFATDSAADAPSNMATVPCRSTAPVVPNEAEAPIIVFAKPAKVFDNSSAVLAPIVMLAVEDSDLPKAMSPERLMLTEVLPPNDLSRLNVPD